MGQKASGQEDSWLLGQLSEGRMEQGKGRAGPGAVQEGGASEGQRPAAAAGLGSWATLPPALDRPSAPKGLSLVPLSVVVGIKCVTQPSG